MMMNNRGFGLIESLVSLLLLSIVMVAGMAFYTHCDEQLGMAMHKKMATEIANCKMEDLKRNGYGSLPAVGTPVVETITVGQLAATRTTTVTDKDDPAGGTTPDYKEVKVRVNWTEAGG